MLVNRKNFESQIKRLQATYGEKAYSEERCKIMWHTFQKESDDVFADAVDDLIMNCRSAPLHAEFHDSISHARRRDQERRNTPMYGSGSIADIFNHAVEVTDANKSFVQDCKKILFDFQSGKITKTEFNLGCDLLDQAATVFEKQRGKNGTSQKNVL